MKKMTKIFVCSIMTFAIVGVGVFGLSNKAFAKEETENKAAVVTVVEDKEPAVLDEALVVDQNQEDSLEACQFVNDQAETNTVAVAPVAASADTKDRTPRTSSAVFFNPDLDDTVI